ncbi:MAG TPA: hypothetical protein VGO81_06935 [Solirubrobacteraceae bacterium]|nr:hypothetical protein [Solirubrobacteraceae bacterium]
MNSLLELPMKAAEFLARISMRLAEAAADATSEWARAQRRARAPRPAPAPPPPATTTAPRTPRAPRADPTAPAPPPPVAASPAPPVAAPPPAPELSPEPPIEVVPDLTRGEAARIREAEREAETTEDSPGAVVHVDEPWQGYKAMKAPEIIDRLRVSDDAVKAVVLLYEGSHRGRKTVLRAAGG